MRKALGRAFVETREIRDFHQAQIGDRLPESFQNAKGLRNRCDMQWVTALRHVSV
jgi:hypothetical protein